MDEHERHHRTADLARMIAAFSVLVIAVCFVVLTIWLAGAQSNAKLFEADNMTCYSQPFAIECHPRTKP